MAKGERSPGDLRLGVDLLEGRFLLSHVAASHAEHELSSIPAQIAPAPAGPRPESETSRPGTTLADVEARDAEQTAAAAAAASSGAKQGFSIPLVTPGRTLQGPDDLASPTQGMWDSARFLRKTDRDEPVAWGAGSGGASGLVWMAHRWAAPTPEVPEYATVGARETRVSLLSTRPPASEGVPGLTPSRGSDLLADFLPSDQPSLERAIDRLLDGFEGLGSDIARGVEATGLVPSPVAWVVALAALEVARRRLRRLATEEDDDPDPDRDPAVGFPGFTA